MRKVVFLFIMAIAIAGLAPKDASAQTPVCLNMDVPSTIGTFGSTSNPATLGSTGSKDLAPFQVTWMGGSSGDKFEMWCSTDGTNFYQADGLNVGTKIIGAQGYWIMPYMAYLCKLKRTAGSGTPVVGICPGPRYKTSALAVPVTRDRRS